jgi:soluble lytic murein transglycosylase
MRRAVSLVLSLAVAGSLLALSAAADAQTTSKSTRRATTQKKKTSPRAQRGSALRARRAHQAFAASADLKPMARQLLETRSAEAYAGVEKYAKRNAGKPEGALAWFVIGYARQLDGQHAPSADALLRARADAGEVRDYVEYFLARAYKALGNHRETIAVLKDFAGDHPDSLLMTDALALHAESLLTVGEPQRAIAALGTGRGNAGLELLLGRAYIAAGQPGEAAAVLRNIYYGKPLSAVADQAGALAKSLPGAPSFEQQKRRADQLLGARRSGQAIEEYRRLLEKAPATALPQLRLSLGVAYYRAKREHDAEKVLEGMPELPGELNAQRLYYLLESKRPDEPAVLQILERIRKSAPESNWFSDALLATGNMYLLENRLTDAARYYAELAERFPTSERGAYAHWKAAWMHYRAGNDAEAKRGFERQVELFPASGEAAAALYWRARMAEDDGELPRARAYYEMLSARYRNLYYAVMARERLKGMKPAKPYTDAVLAKVRPAPAARTVAELDVPEGNARAQKALLLQNAAMYDFAVKELQAAADGGRAPWATLQVARMFRETEGHHRAMRVLKSAVPGYFSMQVDDLPREVWEFLFPRVYWDQLSKHAAENDLDAFTVASLIRQESEFNRYAVSHANAYGLMQLLPGTARKVAREVKLPGFHTGRLTEADVNLQLGTRYFRNMLKEFDGTLEYALAAYNAGPHRVVKWRQQTYRDIPEFVESIPFTETREYVQAIIRGRAVYQQLYGEPARVAGKSAN